MQEFVTQVPKDKCNATSPVNSERKCILDTGHFGAHMSYGGVRWSVVGEEQTKKSEESKVNDDTSPGEASASNPA